MRRLENNQYYLVKYYEIFYIRRVRFEQGNIFLYSHMINSDNEMQTNEHKISSEDKALEVLGIIVFMLVHSQPYFRS